MQNSKFKLKDVSPKTYRPLQKTNTKHFVCSSKTLSKIFRILRKEWQHFLPLFTSSQTCVKTTQLQPYLLKSRPSSSPTSSSPSSASLDCLCLALNLCLLYLVSLLWSPRWARAVCRLPGLLFAKIKSFALYRMPRQSPCLGGAPSCQSHVNHSACHALATPLPPSSPPLLSPHPPFYLFDMRACR